MFDIAGFYEARSVDDAVRALSEDENAELINGGTDVLIRVRAGKDAGRALVSVKNIPEIKGVKLLPDGSIWIGAGTSFTHITNDPLIMEHLPMLGEAVDMVGGPQIRNMGTMGGNICNGATSADSAASAVSLNTELLLTGPEGERRISSPPACRFSGCAFSFPKTVRKISSALVKKRFRRYNFHHGFIVFFFSE